MAKTYNAISYNVIYVYEIDDDAHRGFLKIGKTSFSSKKSIEQLPTDCLDLQNAAHNCIYTQTHRAAIQYSLLLSDLATRPFIMNDGSIQQQAYDDFLVRDVLKNSLESYEVKVFKESNRDSEWVKVDLATIKNAIKAIKLGLDRIPTESKPATAPAVHKIIFRKEQSENVEKTIRAFQTNDKMLWDCKMRYGKTVTAYEVIRRMNEKGLFKKVIVITHRPAVEDGWGEDHEKVFSDTSHRFIDKTNGRDEYNGTLDAENDRQLRQVVNEGVPFIYFASIQDLRGSERVGGKYNKNNAVFDMDWDLLIIDEAHEGTRTEHGDAVITAIKKPETKVLSLSGTPYNIINDFDEERKYTWTYVDEQKAKKEWEEDHPGEKNPYEDLPTMNIFTFDITDQIPESYRYVTEDSAFNFREFFRTWTGDKEKDYRDIPTGKKIGDFVHEQDVNNFLTLISKDDPNSNYPFATDDYRDMFRHTFWLVPGVAAAKALSSLLKQHPRFTEYEIVNIAGDGDEERPYDEALGLVKSAIKTYPKTISISCGKLTTGVTVREWTGVMMLSGSNVTSASGYMQTIFRVQSPGCINGKQKTNCYVFDFAPDRTLKVIAEVHNIRGKKGGEQEKQQLTEFLNFCPVISIDGTAMRTYDVSEMMRQIKRISVEAAINSGFDDDTIYKSDAGMDLKNIDVEILKKLSDVVLPKGKSKKQTEIDINVTGMTNEERKTAERASKKRKKDLTPEEKEALEKLKKQKEEQKKMFDLLRAVSIRLPLLFYGADADITEIIHLKDFVDIVDDESWAEFMPTGLRKELFLEILRYYDEDVVTGAGLRIRKIAKAADELPPTLRAKRIVEILSRFKNPDKETVLTPWRVVNMHLGDSLGGYNFYDESYKKEIEIPRLIEQESVTADILLNEDAKILEMNSKSGLYPLYMAYSIYMMYVDKDERKLPLEKAQDIWFRTLEKNIYILCKTKMAKTITIRTLAGYSKKTVNAIYLPKLIEERMKDIPRLANKLRNPATWNKKGENKMVFDAVVGNPPYQELTGGGSEHFVAATQAKPVFQLFVESAKELNPHYITMIIPARWYSGGIGLNEFRNEMLNDRRIAKLDDYSNSKDCFPTVDIAGGLCYFLWDSKNDSDCIVTNHVGNQITTLTRRLDEFKELFIRSNEAISIIHKVKKVTTEYCHQLVQPIDVFGFPSKARGNDYYTEGDLTLIHSQGKGFISRDSVSKNTDLIDKYKVTIGILVPSNGEVGIDPAVGYKSITYPRILNPGDITTFSYLVIGAFDTLKEAENYKYFITRKFSRFMMRITYSSMHISKSNFAFVPKVSFDRKWSDKDLFTLYELDEKEIAIIESTMRPMEDNEQQKEYLQIPYTGYVEQLLKKYGRAKSNYFKDQECTIVNPAARRTDEGLFCHHIDEDKAIMLSDDRHAAENPYDYQRKERLVYCNLLEHLLLHVKIAEEPRNPNANNELVGIGGAINFIVKQLNDIYGGKTFAEEWRKKIAEQVIDYFDEYLEILNHLWEVIQNNPIYQEMVPAKEDLCKGYDGNIVEQVYKAFCQQ